MKICSTCNQSLSLENFARNKSKKDGLQTYCKECNKDRQKKYYQKNKDYYKQKSKNQKKVAIKQYKEYKRTLKCSECGENHYACLDFHHLNPKEKDMEISLLVRRGLTFRRLKEEIDKCVVLCANCHRKLHSRLE